MSAFGQLSDVYGIRRLRLQESERTIRVEYDATRLTEAKGRGTAARCGIRYHREAGTGVTGRPSR